MIAISSCTNSINDSEDATHIIGNPEKIYFKLIKDFLPDSSKVGHCTSYSREGICNFNFSTKKAQVTILSKFAEGFNSNNDDVIYSKWFKDIGQLESFELIDDRQNIGYNKISAHWRSANIDGHFFIELFDSTQSNSLLVGMIGSDCNYSQVITLNENNMKTLKSLLKY